MSVLRSKRKTAYTEYLHNMAVICRYTKERLNPVPARYRKFICPKVYEPCSRGYTAAILANEQRNTDEGKARRVALLESALKEMLKLQKPLIAAWNILGTEYESAGRWADIINREIGLLVGAMRNGKELPNMIVTLPRKEKIARLAFLKTMCDLHKYTYGKIGHAPNGCKDFISMKIAEFADAALCAVILANSKIPETKADAKRREDYINAAIDNLNGMQAPLLALWNLMDYSERIMDEWAGLLSDELKLLEGLKKADRERFKNL